MPGRALKIILPVAARRQDSSGTDRGTQSYRGDAKVPDLPRRFILGSGIAPICVKSFNGLYALVAATLESDPLSGHLFCFLQIVGATGSRIFCF